MADPHIRNCLRFGLRAQPPQTRPTAVAEQFVQQLLRAHQFAQCLQELMPAEAFRSTAQVFDITNLTAQHLVRVFGVILGKCLINILHAASPRCSVKLLSSYKYTIRPDGAVEMLSLAFKITPHYSPPIDPKGLSTIHPVQPVVPTEEALALNIAQSALHIKDVDEELRANPELRKQLATKKAELLTSAGYSGEAYLQWVADGEPGEE